MLSSRQHFTVCAKSRCRANGHFDIKSMLSGFKHAGKRLFGEALAAGSMEGFFPLIEQFRCCNALHLQHRLNSLRYVR